MLIEIRAQLLTNALDLNGQMYNQQHWPFRVEKLLISTAPLHIIKYHRQQYKLIQADQFLIHSSHEAN